MSQTTLIFDYPECDLQVVLLKHFMTFYALILKVTVLIEDLPSCLDQLLVGYMFIRKIYVMDYSINSRAESCAISALAASCSPGK